LVGVIWVTERPSGELNTDVTTQSSISATTTAAQTSEGTTSAGITTSESATVTTDSTADTSSTTSVTTTVSTASSMSSTVSTSTATTSEVTIASSSVSSSSPATSTSNTTSFTVVTSPIFYRPVIARVYSFNQWTLPDENATTVGGAIASLKPSFVSGLIRLEYNNLTISPRMAQDYNTIREIVLSSSPDAEFDIWLRANQYNSTSSLIAAMQSVLSRNISFDAFSFDNLYSLSPAEQAAVLSTAHAAGKLVGGSWAGPTVPAVTFDYLMTTDTMLQISSSAVAQIESFGAPVMLQINNGPIPVDVNNETEHYDWNFVWSDQQKSAFLTQAAENQSTDGYYFMYPVFWPAGSVTPPTYWDSLKDDSMLALMQTLIQQYNSQPPIGTVAGQAHAEPHTAPVGSANPAPDLVAFVLFIIPGYSSKRDGKRPLLAPLYQSKGVPTESAANNQAS
jgi:hypothetical protein